MKSCQKNKYSSTDTWKFVFLLCYCSPLRVSEAFMYLWYRFNSTLLQFHLQKLKHKLLCLPVGHIIPQIIQLKSFNTNTTNDIREVQLVQLVDISPSRHQLATAVYVAALDSGNQMDELLKLPVEFLSSNWSVLILKQLWGECTFLILR